jgi:ribosomal protein S18 acetylase RimI-like enzyme
MELYPSLRYGALVSVKVEYEVVQPGSAEYVDDAWELKESIREREGVLRQRYSFFSDAYRRSRVHVYRTGAGDIIGFAAVRRDGYILFLAVDPTFRGEGYGERLIADVADDHETVTCHARSTNEAALGFYRHVGFTVERRVDNYYEDGGDAYYLKLGEEEGLTAKISQLVGR